MNKLYFLTLLLLLNACGVEFTEEAKDAQTAEGISAKASDEPEKVGLAYIYADEKGLPECTEENNSMLAFIQSTSSFMTCEEGAWLASNFVGQEFTDPDTGKRWKIASEGLPYQDAINLCHSEGMTLPTASLPENFKNHFVEYLTLIASGSRHWTKNLMMFNGHESLGIDDGSSRDDADYEINYAFCVEP